MTVGFREYIVTEREKVLKLKMEDFAKSRETEQ